MALKGVSKRAPVAVIGVAAALLWGSACGSQKGATQQQLEQARARVPNGAQIFQRSCVECHGQRGEGGPGVPTIMGGSALPVKVKEKRDTTSAVSSGDQSAIERQRRQAAVGEKELRMRFNTAADIYKYLSEEHPILSPPLSEEEWWSALTFVLDAHGVQIPQGGLTAQNAASVKNEN
jgi:mono/diheme cytochrome c family protein